MTCYSEITRSFRDNSRLGVIWVSSVFARGVIVIIASCHRIHPSWPFVRETLRHLVFIRKIMRRRRFWARKCKYVYTIISDFNILMHAEKWYNPSITCFFTLSNFGNKHHLTEWIITKRLFIIARMLIKERMLLDYVVLMSENFQYPFYSLLSYVL